MLLVFDALAGRDCWGTGHSTTGNELSKELKTGKWSCVSVETLSHGKR